MLSTVSPGPNKPLHLHCTDPSRVRFVREHKLTEQDRFSLLAEKHATGVNSNFLAAGDCLVASVRQAQCGVGGKTLDEASQDRRCQLNCGRGGGAVESAREGREGAELFADVLMPVVSEQ